MGKDDVQPLLNALQKFDEIFAVVPDDDNEKIRRIVDWAKAEGKLGGAGKDILEMASTPQLSDADVESRIAEMAKARAARNFKLSDTIRAELNEAGILVEITKDGIRWRRK